MWNIGRECAGCRLAVGKKQEVARKGIITQCFWQHLSECTQAGGLIYRETISRFGIL